ncbi:MAG: RNA polymerase sigma factor [Candidatus Aminicenantes bacterium]|nr:RNA polymerase sigma factor [Candidatus Aminicenantes bacterium]
MTADKKDENNGMAPRSLATLSSLILRSQQGDERAMEEIYDRYKRPLYNLAYRYTFDRVTAEDLLQDIFIKIFTHMKDVQKDATFVAWMYRIAVNTCYSFLRSRRSRNGKTLSLSEVEGKKEEAVYDGHEDSLAKALEEALKGLAERLRSVFLLHDVQGYKHEEIARMLGISAGTSKSQLFKARMRIREWLKENKAL